MDCPLTNLDSELGSCHMIITFWQFFHCDMSIYKYLKTSDLIIIKDKSERNHPSMSTKIGNKDHLYGACKKNYLFVLGNKPGLQKA